MSDAHFTVQIGYDNFAFSQHISHNPHVTNVGKSFDIYKFNVPSSGDNNACCKEVAYLDGVLHTHKITSSTDKAIARHIFFSGEGAKGLFV